MSRILLSLWITVILIAPAAEAAPLPPLAELVDDFKARDQAYNDGKGDSESAASNTLGWGESSWLLSYGYLYELTGDTHWWDKITAHFDRMIANLTDHDGDGYKSWQTKRYSTALVRAEPLHNRGTATIDVPTAKIMKGKDAAEVTGHRYLVVFHDDDSYAIRNATTGKELVTKAAYESGKPITVAPHVVVKIAGKARQGDTFCIWTTAPEAIEYVVHQGMVLMPVSHFVEAALKRPKGDRYRAKAEEYLPVIEKHFLIGNEKSWIDTLGGAGAYRFSPEPTQRYPNRILPHNQYLAIARAWLVLADATQNDLYRKRAVAMAKNFERALRVVDDAYEWYYWDWVENGRPDHSGYEDRSHGHIDVGFVVDAIRRGVVFDDTDGERLAKTLIEKMWNGSRDDPLFGHRVSSDKDPGLTVIDWAELCQWDPRILDLMTTAVMKRKPSLTRTRNLIALHVAKKRAALSSQ